MARNEYIPKVSLGMPVFNGEKYIRIALDSLLGQTFRDFELIISDNASTDGTAHICQEYAARDRRIRYVRHLENKGSVANFSFVLREGCGEYFMWAACDDYWEEEFLSTLVSMLDERSQASLAFSYVHACCGDSSQEWTVTEIRHLTSENLAIRIARYILQRDSEGKANLIYGLMRRRLVLECDALSRYPFHGSDMLFVFQMLIRGHFAVERRVLFHKRLPENVERLSASKLTRYLYENFKYLLCYGDVARQSSLARHLRLLVYFLIWVKFVGDLITLGVSVVENRFNRLFHVKRHSVA